MLNLLAILGLAAIFASELFGQTGVTIPRFEIADVHVSPSATNPYTFFSGGVLRGERYDLRKATMLDLIRLAYTVDADKIVGGPNWLELERFDVIAKAPASTPPGTIRLMLQALLADRFNLVLHEDTRPLPAFVLTMGKGKLKMNKADGSTSASGNPGCRPQPQPVPVSYTAYSCRNVTMGAFAQSLRGMARDYLTNPIVDSTGIEGSWDFDLKWIGRSQVLQTAAERTTIFDAVDKELGLTLELQMVPAPVIVIDRVNEKPSLNPPGVTQRLPPRIVEFDVADVKLSRPEEKRMFRATPGGGLEVRASTLRILISTAWDIDWDHSSEMIAGPKWLDSDLCRYPREGFHRHQRTGAWRIRLYRRRPPA